MAKKSFSRSNVNEATLNITDPLRSSFDLSHSTRFTPQLGAFHPVSAEFIMPSEVFHGSVTPELKLEKIVTPEIGRTRLHTHTFMVPYRRVMNDFKQFMERRPNYEGRDFPSFDYAMKANDIIVMLLNQFATETPSQDEMQPVYLSLDARMDALWVDYSPEMKDAYHFFQRIGGRMQPEFGETLFQMYWFWAGDANRYTSVALHLWAMVQYYAAADTYYRLCNKYYNIAQHNFPTDFYLKEYHRLAELGRQHYDLLVDWQNKYEAFRDAPTPEDAAVLLPQLQLIATSKQCLEKPLEELLRPYMGINSNMDYLGYPIYRQYGDFFECFRETSDDVEYRVLRGWDNTIFSPDMFLLNAGEPLSLEVSFPEFSSDPVEDAPLLHTPAAPLFMFLNELVALTNISSYQVQFLVNESVSGISLLTVPVPRGGDSNTPAFFALSGNIKDQWWTDTNFQNGVNYVPKFRRVKTELALRAAYACWFDEMRDWHLEPRDYIEDPDSWSMIPLLGIGNAISSPIENLTADFFSLCYALLVPRQLYYAKDMLTTVQTEDVYRHVYAPIYSDENQLGPTENSLTSPAPSGTLRDEDLYNRILSITIDHAAVSFPIGNLHRLDMYNSDIFASLRNDLQTMRRTGMLEKWLARNYFYPDTYSGQIEAHYGVTPEDFKILYASYIGGSESDFTGEQLNNPTSTAEAPAGTRTFMGGAGHTDSFSNTFSDYAVVVSFCSITPLVEYDAVNMHHDDMNYQALPFPEYGLDARITCATADFLRGFGTQNTLLGYVPRYLHYRARLDEVHGRFLTDLRSYCWLRDWYNMFTSQVAANGTLVRAFTLSPYSMRINLPLDAFLGLAPWDPIAFGRVGITFMVNEPLPAAVETF